MDRAAFHMPARSLEKRSEHPSQTASPLRDARFRGTRSGHETERTRWRSSAKSARSSELGVRGMRRAPMRGMKKILALVGLFVVSFSVAACRAQAASITTAQAEGNGSVYVAVDTPDDGRALDQYWIAIAPEGAPDHQARHVRFVERGAAGVRIQPVEPGVYEVRLHGNYPRMAHNVVDRRRIEVQ